MVTANRRELARRSIECFAAQTWENRELVIVDDGEQDYKPLIDRYSDRVRIRYHRIAQNPELFLGGLRNLTLELAEGDFCAQWDDDEWFHRDRLTSQMRVLQEQQLDAVVLDALFLAADDLTDFAGHVGFGDFAVGEWHINFAVAAALTDIVNKYPSPLDARAFQLLIAGEIGAERGDMHAF